MIHFDCVEDGEPIFYMTCDRCERVVQQSESMYDETHLDLATGKVHVRGIVCFSCADRHGYSKGKGTPVYYYLQQARDRWMQEREELRR